VRCLCLVVVAGCSLDMSPRQPWVPVDGVAGPLSIEEAAAPTTSGRGPLAVSTQPLRLVTYNVQYGPDPMANADAILGDPALASAGLILIQEIESYPGEGSSRAAQIAARLGFGYVYVPARQKGDGTHGLAILSAFPISDVQKMDLPDAGNLVQHRIAISATINVDGRALQVIDVHLDTDLNARQRIAQLSPAVVDAPDGAVVAGDFNSSWVEWVGGSVPVLSSSGASDQAPILDAYMAHIGYDTPTTNSGPTEHMLGFEQRLDSVFSRGTDVTFGGVPRVGPSDHWPMWVDVAF